MSVDIDVERRIVKRSGKRVDLTRLEFDYLVALKEANGKVLTRGELKRKVKTPEVHDRTVDQHLIRTRKKLKDHASVIRTVPNFGYAYEVEA